MKLSVAYCRVSTDHLEQKNSIIEQKKQWEEFFIETGTRPAKCGLLYKKDGTKEILSGGIYVDEGISGTSLKNRNAFKQMLEDAKLKKFDMIYVEDTSRFSRSVEDGIRIVKDLRTLGIGVYFRKEGWDTLNEDKDFELSLRIGIAQEESRVKSARLKWAMQRLFKNGGWNGIAPFGYDVENAKLKINEDEAKIVKTIFNLYLNEGFGISKVARNLNSNHILTKKGVKWSQTQINTILNNRIYIGEQRNHTVETLDITRHLRIDVPVDEHIINYNEDLRIIDEEMFNLVQLEMKQRTEQFNTGTGHSNKHLLSTLLYCSYCGATFKRKKRHAYKRKDGTSKELGFEWACGINDMYGKDRCSHRNALIEENVIQVIKNEISNRKKDSLDDIFRMYYEKKFTDNIDVTMLNNKKEKLMKEMKLLRTDRLENTIGEDIYKEQMKALNKEITDISAEISRFERRAIEKENAKRKFNEYVKMLETIDLDNLTNTELKKIFNKILVKERITGGKKEVFLCFKYKFLDKTEDEILTVDNESIDIWVKVA